MNTTAKTFTVALAAVAALSAAIALGTGLAHRVATPAAEVVKLERVVIVAKRSDIVAQLPRVVIEGRRTVDTAVAAAKLVSRAV